MENTIASLKVSLCHLQVTITGFTGLFFVPPSYQVR